MNPIVLGQIAKLKRQIAEIEPGGGGMEAHDNTFHTVNYEPELGASQKRPITISDSLPSGQENGHVWMLYVDK
jgi:hypothetical protein